MSDPSRPTSFDEIEEIAGLLTRRMKRARAEGEPRPEGSGMKDGPGPTRIAGLGSALNLEMRKSLPETHDTGSAGLGFVLARLPSVGAGGREPDLAGYMERSPDSIFARRIDELAGVLLRGQEAGSRMLTIAPLHCGEGATTIAICMAEAARRTGKRVLLIDADESYRGLSNMCQGAGRPGLAEVLEGLAAANKVLFKTPRGDVLPVGRGALPPFATEIASMRAFLEETKERYDLVLVDAPALVEDRGATAIGRLCDGLVLVVSCDRPIPASFVAAVDALAEDAGFAGIVLNRASSHERV